MIRLLVADDHQLVRAGLRQLFELSGDITIAAEAASAAQVYDALRQGGIDLLLLDLTMPGSSGDDLVARVHRLYPDLPILILSMHSDEFVVQRVLQAGASGYLTKDGDVESLLSAVRKVAAGGHFLEPAIAQRLALGVCGVGGTGRHALLSKRELQIMCMLARGQSISDIADELVISAKTVSTHKARLMQKMNFTNTTDLLRYALAEGLVV